MNLDNNPSLLENEDVLEDLELFSVEGSNQITELSRHLRSFLNFKKATIRIRFSPTSNQSRKTIIDSHILKCEDKISQIFSQYTKLLRNIDGSIENKIFNLLIKTRAQPNGSEAHLLKKIHLVVNKLWKEIHILSEMEISEYHHQLKVVVGIASLLCIASREFNSLLSGFYKELKLSYTQLEEELKILLKIEEKVRIKEKKNKRRVIFTE